MKPSLKRASCKICGSFFRSEVVRLPERCLGRKGALWSPREGGGAGDCGFQARRDQARRYFHRLRVIRAGYVTIRKILIGSQGDDAEPIRWHMTLWVAAHAHRTSAELVLQSHVHPLYGGPFLEPVSHRGSEDPESCAASARRLTRPSALRQAPPRQASPRPTYAGASRGLRSRSNPG